MKIWAMIMQKDKLVKDLIYNSDLSLNSKNYQKILQEISYNLDIATPVNLPTHFNHFIKFNRVKYIPRDFIEQIDFTALILENVTEK